MGQDDIDIQDHTEMGLGLEWVKRAFYTTLPALPFEQQRARAAERSLQTRKLATPRVSCGDARSEITDADMALFLRHDLVGGG